MNEWRKCIKRPIVVEVRDVRPGEEWLETLDGFKPCHPDKHYIMKGIRGEEYPIDQGIFRETYDLISATDHHGQSS